MTEVSISLHEVKMGLLIRTGGFTSEYEEVELNGQTVVDLAEKAGQYVYAIQTFKLLRGTVTVSGKTHKISSERFDMSPYTYLDGEMYTLEKARKRNVDPRIIGDMIAHDWTHVVRCRTGNWQQFNPEEGDRILLMPLK